MVIESKNFLDCHIVGRSFVNIHKRLLFQWKLLETDTLLILETLVVFELDRELCMLPLKLRFNTVCDR
jgi:hypothetical protein